LEYIGKVTNIEFIVEILGSFSEVSFNFRMKLKSSFDDWEHLFNYRCLEFAKMLIQIGTVNGCQLGLVRETTCQHKEVSLETWVDNE
jgi:hypothetical protein